MHFSIQEEEVLGEKNHFIILKREMASQKVSETE